MPPIFPAQDAPELRRATSRSFVRVLRLLLLSLLAVLAACQDPPPHPVNVMVHPYLLRPGVDPAGARECSRISHDTSSQEGFYVWHE